MNGWLAAACALLLVGFLPALLGICTGPVRRRVLAQNLATVLAALVMLLLSQGYARPSYTDMALVLAVLGPVGTLVYERLLGEELRASRPRPLVTRTMTVLGVAPVPVVVLPVCVAATPGRTTLKLLFIGCLLVAGSALCTRALTTPPGGGGSDGR
ncbi:monovalent cation/H+ antiporter complex subunit F [Streptomyces tubbatahanensis]|uniref:Monovalent cation/H+ antiporter complex subunit F n=1 Tax=Streptomyces tubbatahanensis TaxID=2923272 RepID=A0ABY3Y0A1_9ACTN|nr:monovalent cation/H+ antiporter complex subunit F [Streptomyces tubbatahanensis]UNT00231.1 monovalent cation/H+ antiporter complex subunit F [Streptomyces tubbatahanensis]